MATLTSLIKCGTCHKRVLLLAGARGGLCPELPGRYTTHDKVKRAALGLPNPSSDRSARFQLGLHVLLEGGRR